VAGALNAGFAAAAGLVLIRCDDDLTPAPDMVRRHLAHHRSADRPIGVMGATRDLLPETPYARAYGRPATSRALAAAYARPPELRWLGWAAHNSVTRETWDAAGGFDESYSYREDSDLGLRLAKQGVRLLLDPALEVEHRGAAGDTRTRASRAWVSGASEVLFAARHPDVAAAVSPTPLRGRARVWSTATAVVAAALPDRVAAGRAGALVDRLLVLVPPSVGGRLVALVVEAAARSGRRHGAVDQHGYRAQKDAEIEAEHRAGG
jgi:GT2 family glycosyltransferase